MTTKIPEQTEPAFFTRLIDTALGRANIIDPRLPSVFEAVHSSDEQWANSAREILRPADQRTHPRTTSASNFRHLDIFVSENNLQQGLPFDDARNIAPVSSRPVDRPVQQRPHGATVQNGIDTPLTPPLHVRTEGLKPLDKGVLSSSSPTDLKRPVPEGSFPGSSTPLPEAGVQVLSMAPSPVGARMAPMRDPGVQEPPSHSSIGTAEVDPLNAPARTTAKRITVEDATRGHTAITGGMMPLTRAMPAITSPNIRRSSEQHASAAQPNRGTEPVVNVTIGRIEVRAIREQSNTRQEAQATKKSITLDDYLRRRRAER